MDIVKSRARYNEAEQYSSKKAIFNNAPSTYLKEKALSTAGFKIMKDASFERE
jgi:hypothetical protein